MQTGNGYRVSGIGQLRKGSELADRLMDFAVGVLKVTRELPKTMQGRHIASQLVRSATSAGANYEEARAADSTADFAHKARIASKEARESAYWLRLVHRAELLPKASAMLQHWQSEASQLAAILFASARTARANEI